MPEIQFPLSLILYLRTFYIFIYVWLLLEKSRHIPCQRLTKPLVSGLGGNENRFNVEDYSFKVKLSIDGISHIFVEFHLQTPTKRAKGYALHRNLNRNYENYPVVLNETAC